GRSAAASDLDLIPVLQLSLSYGDDQIACLNAFGDLHFTEGGVAQGDFTLLRFAVDRRKDPPGGIADIQNRFTFAAHPCPRPTASPVRPVSPPPRPRSE